jgi:AcrR family transcriptional regulator
VDASTLSLRQKQKQQTRQEITRVAFELFGRHGFEKVSVDAICEAVGISRATFFNYFKQKESVLADFAAMRGEQALRVVAEIRERKRTFTLRDFADVLIRFAEVNGRLGANSRDLLLQIIFRQASQGALIQTRNRVLAEVVSATGKNSRAAVETMFAIHIATTLEWLMQRDLGEDWLIATVRERLQVALKGAL